MPNYITNRLEFIGTAESIASLVKYFSTYYPETFSKTHDGDFICELGDKIDWYNEKTGVFTRREKSPVKGMPKGWKKRVEPAWTRFPDFNKIIPMPESLNIESSTIGTDMMQVLFGHHENKFSALLSDVSRIQGRYKSFSIEELRKHFELAMKYKNNLDKYGYTNWYEWSNAKWGTKWNASECASIGNNIFEFQTAWSGVPDLIEIIASKYQSIKIIYEYADEDTGSNTGRYDFFNGQVIETKIENGSREAYEMAFKLRPDSKQYYKLINNKYKYVEQD